MALRSAREQVRAEIQRRELERVRANAEAIRERCRSFAEFVKLAWHIIEPGTELVWNWHLDAICMHLEAITHGKLKPRLIVNVPPGSSKSTLVSVLWQAWEWGPMALRHHRFLSTSFELGNVTRDTRKTRDLIMSEWFQALWPEVRLTRTGETSFANSDTGTREGVAFAGIMGKRGDRLTIDDPHSLDGAESDTERDKAVRRFIEGGQSRINDWSRSAIVIVMQRLHQNDLAGAILARQMGFIHLMIPMQFEPSRKCVTPIWQDPRTRPDELMDPVRFPLEAVEAFANDNDYAYAGQYQQRPAPREGGMFKREKALRVANAPAGGIRVRGWDIAGSTKKKSPFTAGVRLCFHQGMIYVENVVRARAEIDQAEQLIVNTIVEDGVAILNSLPQDPGQSGKSQKFHLAKQLQGMRFAFSPETGTKEDRAIPIASQWNAGNVRLVEGPWIDAFLDEIGNFPNSTFKDQVDAFSRAYMELAKITRGMNSSVAGPIIIETTTERYPASANQR